MLARSRHGPFRSLRRLILSSCSFLADQRISLLRFASAVRPSVCSHQFRSVRRPPVQSSRSSFVVPANSVLPDASLRSNPERGFFFSRSLRSGLSCRSARRLPVICSPALLCRPGEQITSSRLRSLKHQGISPFAPLRPALWLILFDLARPSLRPNRISLRSGLRSALFFKRKGSPQSAWPAPAPSGD